MANIKYKIKDGKVFFSPKFGTLHAGETLEYPEDVDVTAFSDKIEKVGKAAPAEVTYEKKADKK